MEKAIALVSGGVKSAVMVAAAQSRYELLLLHIRTGTRASAAEHAAFVRMCDQWQSPKKMAVPLPHLAQLSGHVLFDTKRAAQELLSRGESVDAYVPGLMPALLEVATLCAVRAGAARILIGIAEAPGAPGAPEPTPPDQQKEFCQIYNDLLACLVSGSTTPILEAPLIDLAYAEIIKLGNRVKAPLESAWSCLLASDEPCGQCPGCRRRTLGFLQSGIPDPALERAARL